MAYQGSIAEIICTFLDSLRFSPPGARWSFGTGPTGSLISGFGIEFYVDIEKQRIAALKLLRSPLGKMLDGRLDQATQLLQNFFRDNIELSGGGDLIFAAISTPKANVLNYVSEAAIKEMAERLPDYLEEKCNEKFYLLPMQRLPCVEEINEPTCVWWPGNRNLEDLADHFNLLHRELRTGHFPPGMERTVALLGARDSWLACYARHELHGKTLLTRIGGALLLGLPPSQSLLISGAKQPKGLFSISKENFTFTNHDSPFPHHVQELIVEPSTVKFVRAVTRAAAQEPRLAVALECCGTAWMHSERERFMQIAVAFDALFGKKGNIGRSIREGVKKHANTFLNVDDRTKLLLSMRNELLHGDAFALTQCNDYLTYHERFEISPARDQLNLLRACVWSLSIEMAQ